MIQDLAILFMLFWLLATAALCLLWLLLDGLELFTYWRHTKLTEKVRGAFYVLAFSAMLAAAMTYAYLVDASHV